MRRVVHLSDIHFGRATPVLVSATLESVGRIDPHLVAISGDLTQRARRGQFLEARAFLDRLPSPQLIVPGNHDVPLYNVLERFLDPLGKYRRFITRNLRPVCLDEEIAVVGLNTTQSLTIKDGTIRSSDLRHACDTLVRAGADVVKIAVAHHPFEYPDNASTRRQKAAAISALEALARAGTDVFLTGHLHVSYAGHTAARYKIAGRTAVVVEAGTATSTRGRGEANSFNVLRIEHETISVERWQWQRDAGIFTVADIQIFDRAPQGWTPRAAEQSTVDLSGESI